MVRAAGPITKVADMAFLDLQDYRQGLTDAVMAALTLLGTANATLNDVRRSAIRHKLGPKYDTICKESDANSCWLLGDKLVDKLKAVQTADTVVKVAAATPKRGRGRFHPYRGNFNRNRGAFLGKFSFSMKFEKNLAHEVINPVQDNVTEGFTNVNTPFECCRPVSVPRRVPTGQKQQLLSRAEERGLLEPERPRSPAVLSREERTEVVETNRDVGMSSKFAKIDHWKWFEAGRASKLIQKWKK